MNYLYVIRCLDYYKIGYSKNPSKRLTSLQVSNPFDLQFLILHKCRDAKSIESQLHKQYEKLKIRGEWFALTHNEILEIKFELNCDLLLDLDSLSFEEETAKTLQNIKAIQTQYNAHRQASFVKNESLCKLEKHWESLTSRGFSDRGVKYFKKLLRTFEFIELIEAMDIAVEAYVKGLPGDNDYEDQIEHGLNKIPGIASNRRNQGNIPGLNKLLYAMGIIRNRFPYLNREDRDLVMKFIKAMALKGCDPETIVQIAKESDHINNFIDTVQAAETF